MLLVISVANLDATSLRLYATLMHVYFSGIGGTAIGPLALIAKQAGWFVSGSDKQDSQYIAYLRQKGIDRIHIGQTYEQIKAVHERHPIDWCVHSSAIPLENPNAPELRFCAEQNIKTTKRAELLNLILQEKRLKLLAVAGTHGKTTTTAMVIWLFMRMRVPLSYSVGAKIPFGDMGQYDQRSEYFVYECDEFDRNFLAFEPYLSVITGVSWDHHEIFPTREDYQLAFREFISQSHRTVMWQDDQQYLQVTAPERISVQSPVNAHIRDITLTGHYNRLNAWLAVTAVHQLIKTPSATLVNHINAFPGLQRRMEEITANLYSDYAHTPDKIRGAMSAALEVAAQRGQDVVVVYEPLTNRRQHYMRNEYKNCFEGAKKIYWLPSYLAREDPSQRIVPPEELIAGLSDPHVAEPAALDNRLKRAIQKHLNEGGMVVGMAGGGGGSLDEWLRREFKG